MDGFSLAECFSVNDVSGPATASIVAPVPRIELPTEIAGPLECIFDYMAPESWVGRLADRLFLESYMRRLLEVRNAVIKRVAKSSKS